MISQNFSVTRYRNRCIDLRYFLDHYEFLGLRRCQERVSRKSRAVSLHERDPRHDTRQAGATSDNVFKTVRRRDFFPCTMQLGTKSSLARARRTNEAA